MKKGKGGGGGCVAVTVVLGTVGRLGVSPGQGRAGAGGRQAGAKELRGRGTVRVAAAFAPPRSSAAQNLKV